MRAAGRWFATRRLGKAVPNGNVRNFAEGLASICSTRTATARPRIGAHLTERSREWQTQDAGSAGIGLGGILVIVGIVLAIVWSVWIGIIIAVVGLVAFGGFAKGKWY